MDDIVPGTEQLEPFVQPPTVQGATIQEGFESFHELNPWVLEAYVRLTRDWLANGHQRVGIGMLTEVLRWRYGRATTGDEFKLNNNYRSRYVRAMIEAHPDLAEVFETRELKAP